MYTMIKKFLILFKEQIIATAQLIKGVWLISKLSDPDIIVTIFGGSHLVQKNKYTEQAHELGHMIADKKISVLTGGGPGIMQAANCGAKMGEGVGIYSMGIGVEGLEKRNRCTQLYLKMTNFSVRKELLTRYSTAFTVFPGGFGTLDELNGIVTLIKTKKLKKAPIILFDSAFWQPFITWLTDYALPNSLISQEDITLLQLVDTVDKAYALLFEHCSACAMLKR